MRRLMLYPDLPLPPVQLTEGLDRDPNCTLCDLHKNTPAGQRCVPADGTSGDILVVGEETSEWDRRLERPMAGQSGKWVRDLLKKVAPGRNVVFANAIGCKPLGTKGEDLDTPAEACRPYLSKILEECRPKLVLLLGPMAGLSFLGRTYQALSVRTGYSWCWTDQDGDGGMLSCPVFLLPEPHKAIRNRLIAKAFEADLVEILRDGPWLGPQTDGTYEVVETPQDALEVLSWLSQAPYVATDVETSGMMFEPDFRIECLAVSGGERTFVFPRESFLDPQVLAVLWQILRDLDHCTWNGQYDWCSLATDPLFATGKPKAPSRLNLQSDTRVKRKLITADAVATLAVAAELIGMGGHKEENKAVVERICMELRKIMLATELTPKGKVRKVPPLQYVKPEEVPDVWLQWLKDGYAGEKFAHKFVPKEIEHRYVALDAKTTWHLEGWCNERLAQDEGLLTIWDEVDQPAMWAWCRARYNGFPTDKVQVQTMSDWLKVESEKVLKQIHGYRPEFNPKSSKQKIQLLEELKIKTTRKTESGGVCTDKEVLEEIKDKHPIFPLILKYLLLDHTDVNQVGGLVSDIRSDGRVHPSFLQAGTETGRPSCVSGATLLDTDRGPVAISDPQLQTSSTYRTLSHSGQWRRILRVFTRGTAAMYRVRLEGGQEIVCTKLHRFLTPGGWRYLPELGVGDVLTTAEVQGRDRGGVRSGRPGGGAPGGRGVREVRLEHQDVPTFHYVLSGEVSEGAQDQAIQSAQSGEDGQHEPSRAAPCGPPGQGEASITTGEGCSSLYARQGVQLLGVPGAAECAAVRTGSRREQEAACIRRCRESGSPGEVGLPVARNPRKDSVNSEGSRCLFRCSVHSPSGASGASVVRPEAGEAPRSHVPAQGIAWDLLEHEQGGSGPGDCPEGCWTAAQASGSARAGREGGDDGRFPDRRAPVRRGGRSDSPRRVEEVRRPEEGEGHREDWDSTAPCDSRRGPDCNRGRNPDHRFLSGVIASITYEGEEMVWDLSVEVDESYTAQGFVNHNCTDPNFFNRLKGKDEESRILGNMLRSCHRAPPGWSFIEADEGQIEVRMAANLSQDTAMVAMLNSGVDFHMQSAERFAPVMGKDLSKMSKEEKDIFREVCKITNFAAIYEIPSELGFMLSMRLKVDKKVGSELGDAMFKTYLGLRRWMDGAYADSWTTGYSVTYWRGKLARKRPLWGMGKNPETLAELETGLAQEKRNRNFGQESKFDKTAARSPYNGQDQGSSVDIITSMLWPTQCWLDANTDGGQFIVQVYDSIMVLVRDEEVEKTLDFLIPLMKDELEPRVGYMDGVPLAVDVKVGKSWDSLVKVRKEKK